MSDLNKELSIAETCHGFLDEKPLYTYILKNKAIEISVTNLGCIILSLNTPDKNGNIKNIVAGFKTIDEYKNNGNYFGCVIGRYANRIANGVFTIGGRSYYLKLNDGVNNLHGGDAGFDKKVWDVKSVITDGFRVGVEFESLSEDGEEGFPGNLATTVTYSLNNGNELVIQYKAVTDKPTPVSFTNHSYFNLSGFENDTIHDHFLSVNAEEYTEKNSDNQPTGSLIKVNDTVFDFRSPKKIGENIHDPVLQSDKGYDHNFVLKQDKAGSLVHAATLLHGETGRMVNVFTTQPGLQVYTANFFDGSITGSQDKIYGQHSAIALETQAWPDSPNHSNFPETVLRQGEEYNSTTIYAFGCSSE